MTYTVINGDTIWGIAVKHGISLTELLNANPQITNPSLIFPGQKINIPSMSKYIIKTGDTLWQIAKRFEIELKDLLDANPQIANSSLIYPGQTINIPELKEISNNIRELEMEVINLVNNERSKAGQFKLSENSELSRIARIKSEDFVKNNYFSHFSPTYGSPFDMLRTFGITFTAGAENIASGQRSADEVMKFLMNSPGHRANILNPTFNEIGVGVAKDKNGKLYWTQLFIRK